MADKAKVGGGQGRVRSQLGAGRMVNCSGTAPNGKPCQRVRFQARGVDADYNCGEHRADNGRPFSSPKGRPWKRKARVSPRRKMARRWERRR